LTTKLRLSAAAEHDIVAILTWSQTQFGREARHRYERLIATGLADVADDPLRVGSIARPELGESVRSWHLRGSRDHARDRHGAVQRPRHFIIYRPISTLIVVGRILHDAMELERHIRRSGAWD
jgi:toxin ParE1/3/4